MHHIIVKFDKQQKDVKIVSRKMDEDISQVEPQKQDLLNKKHINKDQFTLQAQDYKWSLQIWHINPT